MRRNTPRKKTDEHKEGNIKRKNRIAYIEEKIASFKRELEILLAEDKKSSAYTKVIHKEREGKEWD